MALATTDRFPTAQAVSVDFARRDAIAAAEPVRAAVGVVPLAGLEHRPGTKTLTTQLDETHGMIHYLQTKLHAQGAKTRVTLVQPRRNNACAGFCEARFLAGR